MMMTSLCRPCQKQHFRRLWRIGVFNLGIALLIWLASIERAQTDEYCQWETFNATCGHNQVILVTSAVYGRMRIGRCVPYDYFVGCSTNVLDQLASRCSGRPHCSVPIPDTELFKVHPCRKDLVAYMEATYQCVPVAGAPPRLDTASSRTAAAAATATVPPCDGEVPLDGPSGYLSDRIAHRTGYGSERCPWAIRAPSGQRIELTIYDFGIDANAAAAAASSTTTTSGGTSASAAGNQNRQQHQQQTSQQQQQQQQQHLQQTAFQNSVLSEHQSPPTAIAFGNSGGPVHCHVVAIYYEGATSSSDEATRYHGASKSHLLSWAARTISTTTAAPSTPRRRATTIPVPVESHSTPPPLPSRGSPPSAVSRGSGRSGSDHLLTRFSAGMEPHHLRLCPSVAGWSVDRGGGSGTVSGPAGTSTEQRKKFVYRTTSNHLFIFAPNVTSSTIKHHHVLLRYDVVGCPDPELPALTGMFRRGDSLTVFCNQTAERWHLVCKGNTWVGTYSNCSKPAPRRPEPPQKYVRNFPLGLLVAIAIGVVSGVVIGFILLIAIFSCRKRFHSVVIRTPTTEQSVLLVNYENRQNAYKLIDFKSATSMATSTLPPPPELDIYSASNGYHRTADRWPTPPPAPTVPTYGLLRGGRATCDAADPTMMTCKDNDEQVYCREGTPTTTAALPDVTAAIKSSDGGNRAIQMTDDDDDDQVDCDCAASAAVVAYPTDVYVTRDVLRLSESPGRRLQLSGCGECVQSVGGVALCHEHQLFPVVAYGSCCSHHVDVSVPAVSSCSAAHGQVNSNHINAPSVGVGGGGECQCWTHQSPSHGVCSSKDVVDQSALPPPSIGRQFQQRRSAAAAAGTGSTSGSESSINVVASSGSGGYSTFLSGNRPARSSTVVATSTTTAEVKPAV